VAEVRPRPKGGGGEGEEGRRGGSARGVVDIVDHLAGILIMLYKCDLHVCLMHY
jgi:hypothetical protein